MLEIIYQDSACFVVNKPTRMLTVPGKGPEKQDCCYTRALAQYPDARVVHRLDMDTSGLLLFARSAEAQRHLSMQFEQRNVHKTYTAVVEGRMESEEGIVDVAMRKDMTQRLPPRHIIDCIRGKQAITDWKVLDRTATTTRLQLTPRTGRSHQLRVHMQYLGHPIIGDAIYGLPADRLMLHASAIRFNHPLTDIEIKLECPAPF